MKGRPARTRKAGLSYGARMLRQKYAQEKKADQIEVPITPRCETVEDFLNKGGTIKKYVYKWPPCWKKTFNGFPKYGKR